MRNSKSYKTSLEEFNGKYHIILRYINNNKKTEKMSDMFIRPIIQFEQLEERMPEETISAIFNDEANQYLVGATTKKQSDELKYKTSMGAGTDQYEVINIMDSYDIVEFSQIIKGYFTE